MSGFREERLSDSVTLFQGDCLEVMPARLLAGSIDLVLADLPYGMTQNGWDSEIPLEPLWAEYERVGRSGVAAVLTASQPFTSRLVMSRPQEFRHEWVWEKNKASGQLNAKRRPMRAHEDILVFGTLPPPYSPQMSEGHSPGNFARQKQQSSNYGRTNGTTYGGQTTRYPRTVIRFAVVNNDSPERIHPTQKPVDLLEYLLRTYTCDGAAVLDNAMGSGSTGVACIRTGRKFVGIELLPDIFDAACRRLAREIATPAPVSRSLFDGPMLAALSPSSTEPRP